MKKVSAVITTHNRCFYLKKAIESVINQTYKNIEILVVDDASNDETQSYCESLREKGIKYIRINKEDSKGGNYARNIGIKNSTGEYIAFLDDDDEWMSTKIEKQVELLNSNEDIGLVYCGLNRLHNEVLSQIQLPKFRGDVSKDILYNIICVTSSIMIRRDLLFEVDLFDENLKFWQEYELTIRIAQIAKVDYINEPLVLYRVNLNDKKRLTNNIDGWLDTVDYINNKHKEKIDILSDEEKKLRSRLICIDGIARCTARGNKKERKKFFLKLYKITGKYKDLLKYILNFCKDDIYLLKLKLYNIK